MKREWTFADLQHPYTPDDSGRCEYPLHEDVARRAEPGEPGIRCGVEQADAPIHQDEVRTPPGQADYNRLVTAIGESVDVAAGARAAIRGGGTEQGGAPVSRYASDPGGTPR